MVYCKKCKNFGCNAAGTERTTTGCEDYMSHLPTNADRIRSMTDEELAIWLASITDCGECEIYSYKDGCMASDEACACQWLYWLRQEAAE